MLGLPSRIGWCEQHERAWARWWRDEHIGARPPSPCPSCQYERARAKTAKRNAVRRPQRPPFEHVKGACSMCGLSPLPGKRRSWCSDACVALWSIATDGSVAAYWLAQELTPLCWLCFDEPGHEVDHRRPLWSLTDQERADLRWWLPSNLQLLGTRCHRAKTAAEARMRAQGVWRPFTPEAQLELATSAA